jgi:hypothetical protein
MRHVNIDRSTDRQIDGQTDHSHKVASLCFRYLIMEGTGNWEDTEISSHKLSNKVDEKKMLSLCPFHSVEGTIDESGAENNSS